MDMSNATAAGPSYGLLDVIFGTKPKEAEQGADGQGFQSLMNLIKGLKEKGKDERWLESSRTDQETVSGKSASEARVPVNPEMFASMALMQQQSMAQLRQEPQRMPEERAARETVPEGRARTAAPGLALPAVDPKAVNEMLREKSLPTLNEAEMKLLREVNGKIELVNRQSVPRPENIPLTEAAIPPEAAVPREQVRHESELAKAMRARGVEPRDLKGVEHDAAAAPEKLMTTETYLKMHEAFGQQATKKNERPQLKAESDRELRWNPSQPESKAPALAEDAKDKGDLFGRADRDGLERVLDPKGESRISHSSSMPFASALVQHMRSGASLEAKDVFLNGAKPSEMREVLLGEVASGVHTHAVRGGGEMKLVIHPEEMGEVKLKIGAKGGKIEVQVTTESREVADLIKSGSRDLENSLGEQNLQLTRFEVTVADNVVTSLESKGSLSEQLLQQNSQNGFAQQGNSSDERQFGRWDGGQGQREGTGFLASENEYGGEQAAQRPQARSQYPSRDSSRRLDVVA